MAQPPQANPDLAVWRVANVDGHVADEHSDTYWLFRVTAQQDEGNEACCIQEDVDDEEEMEWDERMEVGFN